MIITTEMLQKAIGVKAVKWFRQAGFFRKLWMLCVSKEIFKREPIGDVHYFISGNTIWVTCFTVDPTFFATASFVLPGSDTTQ